MPTLKDFIDELDEVYDELAADGEEPGVIFLVDNRPVRFVEICAAGDDEDVTVHFRRE